MLPVPSAEGSYRILPAIDPIRPVIGSRAMMECSVADMSGHPYPIPSTSAEAGKPDRISPFSSRRVKHAAGGGGRILGSRGQGEARTTQVGRGRLGLSLKRAVVVAPLMMTLPIFWRMLLPMLFGRNSLSP